MIAIAKIGGHQAIVKVGDILEVDKLDAEVGKTVSFETLLMSEEDGSGFQMGDPLIKDILVEAKVLEHGRGKKIRVFKMKPRKRYRRLLGHRQDYTIIEIAKIGKGGTTSTKSESKKEESTKEVKSNPVKKTPPKAKTTTKTTVAKKAPAKKKA